MKGLDTKVLDTPFNQCPAEPCESETSRTERFYMQLQTLRSFPSRGTPIAMGPHERRSITLPNGLTTPQGHVTVAMRLFSVGARIVLNLLGPVLSGRSRDGPALT